MTEQLTIKQEVKIRTENLAKHGYQFFAFDDILHAEITKTRKLIIRNIIIKTTVLETHLNTYEYLILAFLCESSRFGVARTLDEIQAHSIAVFGKFIPNFTTHLGALKKEMKDIFSNLLEIENIGSVGQKKLTLKTNKQ
jgi:hypothetical protein